MTDNLSPRPDPGRSVRFEFRRAVWVVATPRYEAGGADYSFHDLRTFWYYEFFYPFFSFDLGWWHGYLGWKRNLMEDPAFFWRDLKIARSWQEQGKMITELSIRFGVGAWS